MIPTTINSDLGHAETEALILRIEKDLYREYVNAAAQMQSKFNKWLKKFNAEDTEQREKWQSGEITKEEYMKWRARHILIGSHWSEMRDVLARDAVNADIIAMQIVKGYMPEAYAIGMNYSTYLIESGASIDTSFTLYDRATVERLWRDNPKLLPDPAPNSKTARKLKENKDLIWNKQHIQSAVTQGILQGEPLSKVASRLRQVTDMDERAAKRNAGTMLTSAQNGGRMDGLRRAESMGIELKKIWLATLDSHTRDSHVQLDGQEKLVDEPFESELGKIMFPSDPDAENLANVYGCRCTLITQIKGFERDVSDLGLRHDDNMSEMTYDEWKRAHRKE